MVARTVGWILAALVMLCVHSAAAAEPTEAQSELYHRAHAAFEAGDYATATSLLRSALELGELNILYLSLGRALYREHRCREADDAYLKALSAPAVSEPAPSEVAAKVETYRADLTKSCPGTLVVRCRPPNMRMSVDEQPAQRCAEKPIELPPGDHVIAGEERGRSVKRLVRIEAMHESEVTLELPVMKRAPAARRPTTEREAEPSPLPIVGGAVAGIGAAALIAAVIIDVPVLDSAIEDFEASAQSGDGRALERSERVERMQAGALGCYVGGGLLVAAGAAMLLYWALAPRDEVTPTRTGALIRW